jgi:urease accessory protein
MNTTHLTSEMSTVEILESFERVSDPVSCEIAAMLVLDYDQRQKSRLRVTTECGLEIGVFLPRGESLHDQDILKTTDGRYIRVLAAAETLSEVVCEDTWMLARAAYHLGNRHVPLQVLPGILRYQEDYVLDDMIRQLGLSVTRVQVPFQPEKGAYHSHGGHSHGHGKHGHGAHAHGQPGNVWKVPDLVLK